MSDLYNASPNQYGGFDDISGGSSNKGFYQQPQNLPFYQGRSILATIPEYQRNPLMLERDLLIKVSEGRQNFMKILTEGSDTSGMTVNDVRFRVPIEQEPLPRLYLAPQSLSVNTSGRSTVKILGNKTKIATAMPGGNPKQVGDIARLEVDQFVMMMFSWVEPRRTAVVSGSSTVSYNAQAIAAAPVPEICRVLSVDYAKSTCIVERQWAGSQRSSFTYSTTTVPTVAITDNSTAATWGISTPSVPEKFAFIIPMAKTMKEDEIDLKVKNFSNTWQSGILQRHAEAWGSQYFAEVISKNLGIQSPMMKSKRQAIKDYFDHWEWQALFGEQSESWDSETGYWSGTTDGLLAHIPNSHYLTIKGIDFTAGFNAGASANLGTFHPLIFNKMLEGKAYIGSQNKVLVCGSSFYNSFATMINFMTQNVNEIRSEWGVVGKRFSTSDGLVIDVIPSDKMSLNGLANSAILYDKQYFRNVKLNNYPTADILEIQNENPLKTNGLIHGVKGYIDSNPDTHWMFTIADKLLADGTTNPAYAGTSLLGDYLG